jgi:hypothetical protein
MLGVARLDAQRRLVRAIHAELAQADGPKLTSMQLVLLGCRSALTADECRYYDRHMRGTIEARAFWFGVFMQCGTPDRAARVLYEQSLPR